MATTYKAFVSSTYEDLKAHRAYVIESLRKSGIFVDPMEDWSADADEPKRFSTDRLDGCDLCVLLVAFRRGFVPPGESRSITQLEYQAAIDRGIDVLVFLLDDEAPWRRRFDERDEEFKRWRTELMARHGVSRFGLEPRSIEIQQALTRWVARQKAKGTDLGFDWVHLVSNVLGLPNNEPETWAVARRLLPHALAVVEREYYATVDEDAAQSHTRDAEALVKTVSMQKVLSSTADFWADSHARFARTCFVLMPFGQKEVVVCTPEGEHRREMVDFDSIYQHVFAPAITSVRLPEGNTLQAVRADDTFVAGGKVPGVLFDYLEYSRVVLADITGLNPNVFYELGHRHRARATGTVIFRQRGATVPFDISMITAFPYEQEPEEHAAESREFVTRVLQEVVGRSDWVASPFFASLKEKKRN